MTTLDLLLGLSVLSLAMAALWVNHLYQRQRQVWERLNPTAGHKKASTGIPPWLKRLIDEAAVSGERYTPAGQRQQIERLLFLAGQPGGLDTPGFLGVRFLAIMAGLALGILLTFVVGSKPIPVLVILAYFIPLWWLKGMANDRQAEISASLPDFLDTLAISLKAGVGFLPALRKAAERFGGPLGSEFTRIVEQIDMGVPMARALRSIANRTASRDLELTIGTLTQSLDLGVPVSASLIAQAAAVRQGRVQRAREQAAKASPKITLLTTFLVTPGVFLLLIGIVLLNIFYHPERYGLDFFLN